MKQAVINILRLGEVAYKSLVRNRLRSTLTLLGVAAGMFLFTAVTALQDSLDRALTKAAADSSLIVFQADRFCPSTSILPEHYSREISKMSGVKGVYPIQIWVNNCGASLDVITFRGITPDYLKSIEKHLKIVDGSLSGWPSRNDAAVVPESFAKLRNLSVGDMFDAAGVKAHVVAISQSDRPEDATSIYVPLDFLQQTSRMGLGNVTMFQVDAADAKRLDALAIEIDARYRTGTTSTKTRAKSEFFTETAGQMLELIGFSKWLGVGAVIAVLGLLSNSALLAVRGRIKEAAIYQTIGWSRLHVACLTLWEGIILGIVGGIIGAGACILLLSLSPLTMGNEGVSLMIQASPETIVSSLGVSVLLGLIATLWPAWAAARKPLADSLR